MKHPDFFRKTKQWINRHEWQRSLLGLPFSSVPKNRRGLVLIQIDGLSFPDLKRALAKKYMPFLSQLLDRENYRLWPLFSGIPSNTPAFQGEFFFGQPQCVPAFQYRDRDTGEVRTMFDKYSAFEVEKRLLEKDPGLMEGGSAYGNIFSGGAKEAYICASTADWVHILKAWNPYSLLITFLFDPFKLIRTLFLCVTEAILSIFDFFRGSLSGQDIVQELFFILTRLFGSIVIRDVATAHAQMDIYRGLPAVHVNYFGYDEQAHRRGPSTRFAYWSLSGIDAAAKRLWKAAHRAKRRHYDVWIYSDHGQEKVEPFQKLTGHTIQQAVYEIYYEIRPPESEKKFFYSKQKRGDWGDTVIGKRPPASSEKKPEDKTKPLVTTLGPICQVYFPTPFSDEEKRIFVRRLIDRNAVIPLAALPLENKSVEYYTKDGIYTLPRDAEKILGANHPYLEETTADLETLLTHESRGDVMLFGWAAGCEAISYSNENGAHAGLGPGETQAFALLSEDAPLKQPAGKTWIRAIDLRHAASVTLGKKKNERQPRQTADAKPHTKLRVLSYNVHSCIGTDGILSAERIARVIAKADPDVVALQELDSGRRIKGEDQASAIAKELEMHFHFHSVCGAESQCFGNAILSRYPIKVICAEHLPMVKKSTFLEPRGILAVEIDFKGRPVHIANTHLSIWAPELKIQIHKLLSHEVLKPEVPEVPLIFCGDFNLNQGSSFYKKIRKHFDEPDFNKNAGVYANTWPSKWPIRRLDHIFMKGKLSAEMIMLPRTRLEKHASDHLPVAADFELL